MSISEQAYGVFNQVLNLTDPEQVGPFLDDQVASLQEAGHSEEEIQDFLATLDGHFFRLKPGMIHADTQALKISAHQELVRLRGLKALSTMPME